MRARTHTQLNAHKYSEGAKTLPTVQNQCWGFTVHDWEHLTLFGEAKWTEYFITLLHHTLGCLNYCRHWLGKECYLKACTFIKFNSLQLMSLMFQDKLGGFPKDCESKWCVSRANGVIVCYLLNHLPLTADICLSSENIGSHSLRVSKWECRICPEADNSYFLFLLGNSEKTTKTSLLGTEGWNKLQCILLKPFS